MRFLACRSSRMAALTTSLLAALAGAACGGDKDPVHDARPAVDPQLVLRDLAEVVIVPGHRDLHARAQDLVNAARALCTAPAAATLDAAQDAWRATRAPWKRSEAFGFGPVDDLRIDTALDFWPARASSIETELAKTDPVAENYAATLGDTLRGLPVMEYILFDHDGGDGAVLAALQDENGQATRTCQYVVALAVDVELRARTLLEAWDPASGDFAGELARAGIGSTVYADRAKAISAVVNAFVQLVQTVEGIKLATPLGLRDGGTPQPQAAESWRSGNSQQDIIDNLAGVRSMYTTAYGERTGTSFHDAVAALDPALDAAILAQLDATDAAVAAIALPLDRAVSEAPETVDAAFQSAKELFRLLAVDMVTLLGVTLSFSDNDGD
jgi:predicted lipoprotein